MELDPSDCGVAAPTLRIGYTNYYLKVIQAIPKYHKKFQYMVFHLIFESIFVKTI